MNIQGWFPLGLSGLISLLSKGLSRVFSSTTVQKHQFFGTQPSLESSSYIHTWLLEKTALTIWTFVSKGMMSLFFNMLSRLVIAFLPRNKHLLISWLQSPSAVILESKKISVTVSTHSPSICHEMMGLDAMILVFWMLSFKPTFLLSSFTFIKRFFSSSSLSAVRVVPSPYLEKEMATHSSVLAWRIPRTEGPGGLQSTGLKRVGCDWVTNTNFKFKQSLEWV